jgi:N-6 DNA Methylase
MVKRPSIHQTRKTFEKLFNNAFLFRQDKFDGWSDWLTITSCSVHQGLYQLGILEVDEHFQRIKQDFQRVAERYSPEQMGHFKQLTTAVSQLLQSGYDIMGDLFQLMELHNPHAAQYFTPPDVSALIVRLGMGNLKEQIEEQGRVTIADHACGSGGLLLAAADYIEALGYDPKEVAVFEGIDLDRDCFNMAYIQLALRGLQAVIHHGNTLTLKITETRCTPMLLMYHCWQWEMEQQRQKDEELKSDFELLGCSSDVLESVPFMQWGVLPKDRVKALYPDLDVQDVEDDWARRKARNNTPAAASVEAKPDRTHPDVGVMERECAVSIDEAIPLEAASKAPPTVKPTTKSKKRRRIQINPDVEQLSLFD